MTWGLRGAVKLALELFAAVSACALVAACSVRPGEIGREPSLSPVGAGIQPQHAAAKPIVHDWRAVTDMQPEGSDGSIWRKRGADLLRDSRARRTGDILTVTISIKDKASFDNTSRRSRESSHGFGLDLGHEIDWKGFASAASAKAQSTVKSNTAQDGKGATARSESIDLRLAAVVVGVLPNGNLVIRGSQELQVNYEIRVLTFEGIVNVADIKSDNTIAHDRIAEARMAYGGRGRSMEIQQPAWAHQVLDLLFPF